MALFPCIIGGGNSPIETKELMYSMDESQGGVWVNSNIDTTLFTELYFRYTDSVSDDDYTKIVKVEDIAVYTAGGADVFTTVFPSAISGLQFNVRIYNNELYVSFNGVGANTRVVGVYKKITVKGNATVKQGTFVSASTQFGIVDVNLGFKPDLLMVFMKLNNQGEDTCSYWEKDASWAETKAIWDLVPQESASYLVDLERQSGETGIQAINNNGFSFMSNGGNTQGCTCRYIAVKYEAEPQPEAELEFFSCCHIGTSPGIILPYTLNADYKVTVSFYEEAYSNDAAVIGNTSGSYYSHLTEYNSRWYTSSGTRETSFGSWVGQTEHTFINNNGDSKNEFDGVEVTDYTPTTDVSYYYTIACRGNANSNRFYDFIKSYKIESISTGDVICELKPAKFTYQGITMKQGLFDIVNNVWYDNGTMIVSNDH